MNTDDSFSTKDKETFFKILICCWFTHNESTYQLSFNKLKYWVGSPRVDSQNYSPSMVGHLCKKMKRKQKEVS